jgi:hypothetical protein
LSTPTEEHPKCLERGWDELAQCNGEPGAMDRGRSSIEGLHSEVRQGLRPASQT